MSKQIKINDAYVRGIIGKKESGVLVSWYLMTSYAYYIEDDPIISDGLYDDICFLLLNATDQMLTLGHPHAGLVDMDALEAGTAYHLRKKDYPKMVAGAVSMFRSNLCQGEST